MCARTARAARAFKHGYPYITEQLLLLAFEWYIGLGVYDQRITSYSSISESVRSLIPVTVLRSTLLAVIAHCTRFQGTRRPGVRYVLCKRGLKSILVQIAVFVLANPRCTVRFVQSAGAVSRRGSPQSGGDKSQTIDRRPLYPHTIGQLLSRAFEWYIGLGVYDQRISSNCSRYIRFS